MLNIFNDVSYNYKMPKIWLLPTFISISKEGLYIEAKEPPNVTRPSQLVRK